jgi:RNA polymerase sigma-70 factor (ECF subfamily)
MLPWLLITATNVARNLRRSASRYRQLLDGLPVGSHLTDEGVVDEEATAALRSLSLSDQRVITLCVLEDYSEADAASVLGVPRGTVKSRLSRAKRRLADGVHQSRHTHQVPVSELSQ